MPVMYYAHTLEGAGPERWQPLYEHLKNVAGRASRHADVFGSAPWGELAGWWHDLGKYGPDFQSYLLSFVGDPSIVDASVLDDSGNTQGSRRRVDHSSAGAVHVYERCGGRLSWPATSLAMVIAGHHGGLHEHATFPDERLKPREKQDLLRKAEKAAPADLRERSLPEFPAYLRSDAFSGATRAEREREANLRYDLWTRMLLSALVDADRLDTEQDHDRAESDKRKHRSAARERLRSSPGRLAQLKQKLDAHLVELEQEARSRLSDLKGEVLRRAEAVLDLRRDVLAACRAAATQPPGKFSLTVPTGGGKTLAALAFALEHALDKKLRRVIVVIPYTSIIDQTARVYRKAFGPLGRISVIEHHSNLDPMHETFRNRLASENWDAPVIVTTAVQFFESLFACHPSSVRKLHNIARCVVVFDEVQTLPHHLRSPIFEVLNQLVEHYGVSALFCTATQPALDKAKSGRDDFPHLPGVREVIADVPGTFAVVRNRVRAEFPDDPNVPTTWEALAAEIDSRRHEQVLVIVHRRQDARDLCRLLPAGTFHLSALMCAAHRREVLDQIVRALDKGEPCRVVSTTLIEAGVDVDFPVVYRALGGVDAMAQAAGRCNRNGHLHDAAGHPVDGRLILFRAPTDPPKGLQLGLAKTLTLLAQSGPLDLFDPATYERYFVSYLDDQNTDTPLVMRAREQRDFPEVERLFQMIPGEGQVPIAVPYRDDAIKRVEDFRKEPGFRTLRALQPYLVNASQATEVMLTEAGLIETIHEQVRWLKPDGGRQYDPRFGLFDDRVVPLDPSGLITDDPKS
jgi:CRISPR-associated endonuclease/helicase Cas3